MALVVVILGIIVVFAGIPLALVWFWVQRQKGPLVRAWERIAFRNGGHLAPGTAAGGTRALFPRPWGSVTMTHVVAPPGSRHHHAPGEHTHVAAALNPTSGARFLVGSSLPLLLQMHELAQVAAWQGLALHGMPSHAWIVVEEQQVQVVMPGVLTDEQLVPQLIQAVEQLAGRALQGYPIHVRDGAPRQQRLGLAAVAA